MKETERATESVCRESRESLEKGRERGERRREWIAQRICVSADSESSSVRAFVSA